MSSSKGLYYAAMDADTDGEEGKYYSFSKDELEIISENTDFSVFTNFYNIDLDKPWENNRFLLLPKKADNEMNDLILSHKIVYHTHYHTTTVVF